MKQEAIGIYNRLQSSDPEEVKAAMGEYLNLVGRFYEDNKYYLAPQQYEVAKKDFEYFMRLIDLAEEHHRGET
ncbi:MAG: hypothetical protein JRC93_08130 [Deltaproteobacteria bacterium]|nr:hypothetical protein [Deltaproteobacteria bacterium]